MIKTIEEYKRARQLEANRLRVSKEAHISIMNYYKTNDNALERLLYFSTRNGIKKDRAQKHLRECAIFYTPTKEEIGFIPYIIYIISYSLLNLSWSLHNLCRK